MVQSCTHLFSEFSGPKSHIRGRRGHALSEASRGGVACRSLCFSLGRQSPQPLPHCPVPCPVSSHLLPCVNVCLRVSSLLSGHTACRVSPPDVLLSSLWYKREIHVSVPLLSPSPIWELPHATGCANSLARPGSTSVSLEKTLPCEKPRERAREEWMH